MNLSTILLSGTAVVGVLSYLAFANVVQRGPEAATATQAQLTTQPTIEIRQSAEFTNDLLLVKQQLARQSEVLAFLRAELAKKPQAQDTEPNTTDNPTPLDPAAREAEEDQAFEHIAAIEANFATERPDPAWAAAMVTTVKDVVNKNEVFRAAVASIECHSVTCRIEMKDDGGEVSEQIPRFMMDIGVHLPSSTTQTMDDGNGRKTVVFYMSKENSGA